MINCFCYKTQTSKFLVWK